MYYFDRQFSHLPTTPVPGQGQFGGGFPGFPSQQIPGGSFPGSFFPGQSGQQPGTGTGVPGTAPTAPPPSVIPQQQSVSTFAVDPGAISGCLYRYTYIWMRGNNSFWFYPTFVGRRSVAGYRWTGFTWVYFGVDLRRIQSFQCV